MFTFYKRTFAYAGLDKEGLKSLQNLNKVTSL